VDASVSDDDQDEQPIGDLLDSLGITATVAEGELVAGALVLLKVIDAEGDVRLSMSHSEGLGWIERAGMLAVAQAAEMDTTTGRREPGA
jgi:hypothetical protein